MASFYSEADILTTRYVERYINDNRVFFDVCALLRVQVSSYFISNLSTLSSRTQTDIVVIIIYRSIQFVFAKSYFFIQAIRYTNINICCFDIQNMGSIHELGYKGKVLLIRLIYIIWNMTRTGKDIKYGRKWENKYINVDMILFCQHFPLITPQFVSFLKKKSNCRDDALLIKLW